VLALVSLAAVAAAEEKAVGADGGSVGGRGHGRSAVPESLREKLGPKMTLEFVGDLLDESTLIEMMASDVLVGLSSEQKYLPSVYHYDDEGSRLYSEITELDEYYPTRTEAAILEANKGDIARFASGLDVGDVARPFHLVELGAGDGRKTRVLLDHFIKRSLPFDYVSVDISEGALRSQATSLMASGLDFGAESSLREVRLMVADNVQAIRTLRHSLDRVLVMFLGSSIGNFDDDEILQFLGKVWQALRHGDLLYIGFDLRKDPTIISRAYNDSHGVTAAFNLNILDRLNKQLDANFSVDAFQFFSWYDAFNGYVTSVLQAKRDHRVAVRSLRRTFDFMETEVVHTEVSRKFRLSDIERYAEHSGFDVVSHFLDEKRWMCDSLWRVNKLRDDPNV